MDNGSLSDYNVKLEESERELPTFQRQDSTTFSQNLLKDVVVQPVLCEKAAHNGKVVYSLDFEVTPHQLRHTYITNLIHASVDPKTVQYLAGHENSKITMDIYAKVKYNRPDDVVKAMGGAFAQWNAAAG